MDWTQSSFCKKNLFYYNHYSVLAYTKASFKFNYIHGCIYYMHKDLYNIFTYTRHCFLFIYLYLSLWNITHWNTCEGWKLEQIFTNSSQLNENTNLQFPRSSIKIPKYICQKSREKNSFFEFSINLQFLFFNSLHYYISSHIGKFMARMKIEDEQ